MEILFGQDRDGFQQDHGGLYVEPMSSLAFFYKLEMRNIDTVVVRDCAGRSMPFGLEEIPELVVALETMYDHTISAVSQYNTAKNFLEELKIDTY